MDETYTWINVRFEGKKSKFLDVHWLKFTSGKIPCTRCQIGILRITPGYSVWLWCFRKEESQSKTKVTPLSTAFLMGEAAYLSERGLLKCTNALKINCSTSIFFLVTGMYRRYLLGTAIQ